eukprot:14793618-Heterocapsa_arctica.AAC.1
MTPLPIGSGSGTPPRGSKKPAHRTQVRSSSGANRTGVAHRAVSGLPLSAASTEAVAARF